MHLGTGAEVSFLSFDVHEKLAIKPKLSEKLKLVGIFKDTNAYAWLDTVVKISFDSQHVYEWSFLLHTLNNLL